MRFAVAGGGWYGSHIALSLKSLGYEVVLFEKNNDLFSGASGSNQFRLHQGFHYARSYRTRVQSRDGYLRFLERYPSLSSPVKDNIYAVPAEKSLIDYLTYKLIMTSSGIAFSQVEPDNFDIRMCDGALQTDERVLLTRKAKDFFKAKLGSALALNENVSSIVNCEQYCYVNGKKFDYFIDATWGGLSDYSKSVFYEPTLLLYYETTLVHAAITFVDGDLCSIYPTEQPNVHTLSSVPHTPLGRFACKKRAEECLARVDAALIREKRSAMEDQVREFYPTFTEKFKFLEPQLSVKTKILGTADDRSCYVEKERRTFRVLSGKIDTIFSAMAEILNLIEAEV